jgi:hypothetical protein
MQTHTVLDDAEAGLAGIGGEILAGSGFENEDPDNDFASGEFADIAATQRED